ncbi:hypothetical protein [Pseudonocardia lacus]|uniref:hypothetical protein n=1 Tax=Pseudonocardia lacus TaxID=2835865 RepID=UPI001BDDAE14|nr:hypothetical protein [Pseudonocardia lacus]
MTGRLRGAGPAGDAAQPVPAIGAVTGWLGRLGDALRGPGRAEPPAGMTVADLVSARGLDAAPPAPATAEPAPVERGPGPAVGEPAIVHDGAEDSAVVEVAVDEPVVEDSEAADPDVGPAAAVARRDQPFAVAEPAPEPALSTALPPPSDPDLLAPPWVRVAPAEPDRDPVAVAVLVEEPDPAVATDRLTHPPPAVIASTPAPAPPPIPAPSAPPRRAPTRFSVAPRPTVVDDLSITGLTRRSRSLWGSRLFALFFAFVYLTILVQLVDSLLHPVYR